MQDSMYKYLKMGFVHFMAYPAAMKQDNEVILSSIDASCKDDYFTAIEVMKILDDDTRAQAKAMLDQSGMKVCFAAQPVVLGGGLNINSADEATREKAVETLIAELDVCEDMGSEAMAFLSGKSEEGVDYDTAEAACIKSLQAICDAAAKKKLKIVLETFDTTVDKKAFVGESDKSAALARKVDRDNFGLMLDLSHLPLLGETPKQALTAVKDFLVHAHVGNAYTADESSAAYGDQHPRFGYPDSPNGVEQLADYLRCLFEVGYLGDGKQPVVSFEVKPLPGESSEIVLANAKRCMNEAWAQV
jgi:sugar phosphate isomerase/epimerase